jgi:hypothetical protein
LAKLEEKGIVLAGIEVSNEINWAGFNADFPLPGQGRIFGPSDLTNDPEAQQIAKGLLLYVKSLEALKDVRDHLKLNQHTPIISAGLADLETPTHKLTWIKADAVSPDATLDFLRAMARINWSTATDFTFIQIKSLLLRGGSISGRMGWSNAVRREPQQESHVGLRNGDLTMLSIRTL